MCTPLLLVEDTTSDLSEESTVDEVSVYLNCPTPHSLRTTLLNTCMRACVGVCVCGRVCVCGCVCIEWVYMELNYVASISKAWFTIIFMTLELT